MVPPRSKYATIFSIAAKPRLHAPYARLMARLKSDPKYAEEVKEHEAIESRPPRIAISDMTPQAVDQVFQLKYQEPQPSPWDLKEDQMRPVPRLLNEVLQRCDSLTLRSHQNEPLIRGRLSIMLILILAEEVESAARSSAVGRPSIDMMNSIFWSYETCLATECKIGSERKIFHGYADYSLYYGSPDDMETNLLVVEAKQRGEASAGVSQLLGYMGIVHWIRKTEKKQKTSVFGLSTDSYCFTFCYLDESSRCSVRTVNFGLSPSQDALVVSYLAMILTEAAQLSPTAARVSGDIEALLSGDKETMRGSNNKKRKSNKSG